MATFLAALQSEDRQVRWDRVVMEAFYLASRDGTRVDDSVVPYLIKELTTDYSSYVADARARADEEWDWKKSLHAAWLVQRAREDLSGRREAGSEERAHLRRRLATAEEKAKDRGIDVTAITRDGDTVYYGKGENWICPDKWPSIWDDRTYRYDEIYMPNRFFAAVLVILARLGPRAESALPALLDFAWDSDRDTVQTPWEESWQVEGGYTYVKISKLLRGALYNIGPQVIPDLIQALGRGEPAATRAAAILRRWGSKAVPGLLGAVDDPDMVVRQRVRLLLARRRARARIENPSRFKDEFSRIHARLRILVDQDDPKTKERLRTLRLFVEHGSFRKVAAAESERSGLETDHSGPASRLRRLGESLGVPMTRICEGQGVKRTELTEEGRALAEWLALNPWAID